MDDSGTTQHEQVIIVSSQPVPNLIPALAWRPTKAHLLVSEQMRPQAARLRRLLTGSGIACAEHPIDPYSMEQVEATCHALLAEAPHGSVILNATGGTKVAAFGAFAAFRERGFPIVYFDPERWRIVYLDCSGKAPETVAAQLSVADYLAAHGLNVIDTKHDADGVEQRAALSSWLARELPKAPGIMTTLNALATAAVKEGNFPCRKVIAPCYPQLGSLLERLDREGMVSWERSASQLTFPTENAAAYLGGFWLEEYVYRTVRELAPFDLCCNVEVAWDGSGKSPVTNEFDVVFTTGCRLFLISCKTSRLADGTVYKDKNPVYELDSLKDDAAGLYGQGVLVSASPLGTQLQKRAAALRLITVSGEELPWLAEKLRAVIS